MEVDKIWKTVLRLIWVNTSDLSMSAWVYSGCSSFLPQPIHVRWTGVFGSNWHIQFEFGLYNNKVTEFELFLLCLFFQILNEVIIHPSCKTTYWSCDNPENYVYKLCSAQLLGRIFISKDSNQCVFSGSRTSLCSFYINKLPVGLFVHEELLISRNYSLSWLVLTLFYTKVNLE